VKLEEALLENT